MSFKELPLFAAFMVWRSAAFLRSSLRVAACVASARLQERPISLDGDLEVALSSAKIPAAATLERQARESEC